MDAERERGRRDAGKSAVIRGPAAPGDPRIERGIFFNIDLTAGAFTNCHAPFVVLSIAACAHVGVGRGR